MAVESQEQTGRRRVGQRCGQREGPEPVSNGLLMEQESRWKEDAGPAEAGMEETWAGSGVILEAMLT